MCLVVIAHRASAAFPLVIAANRDESYDRATAAADFWHDAPHILAGRDLVLGGTWMGVTRSGRFAAVTNLRGAVRKPRSRGFLVRDFLAGDASPDACAADVIRHADAYSGFHLVLGLAGESLAYASTEAVRTLPPGIHAFSNAPSGESWPKTTAAEEAMTDVLNEQSDPSALAAVLLTFLSTRRGTGHVESEPFIPGVQYGTRSSTIVVVDAKRGMLFVEQTWLPHGEAGGRREWSLALTDGSTSDER
jgi:uncharacterized protein with NRDE domain